MKSMPVAAMFMPVPRYACSLQVFLHPRQAVFGFSRGHVFRADPALIAQAVDALEQKGEIDLPRAGLVPVGHIGDLYMPDSIQVSFDGFHEVVPHDPHVLEVASQFELGGARLVRGSTRLSRSHQAEPGNASRVA